MMRLFFCLVLGAFGIFGCSTPDQKGTDKDGQKASTKNDSSPKTNAGQATEDKSGSDKDRSTVIAKGEGKSELESTRFTDVYIEKPFREILLSNPGLMETPGAKILKTPEGNYLLLGISSTVLKGDGPEERVRAEQVSKFNALREVVATTQGVQIGSIQRLEDRNIVVIDKEGVKSTTVSEYLQITTARVEGIAKDMMVIGRWKSMDGKVFYLAVGRLVDRQGVPIPE